MALLCAAPSGGNLNAASSWVLGSAGANANQYNSKQSQTVGTTVSYSAAFTIPVGETVDGVYLSINRMTTPGTGTFTVILSGDGVTETNVTTFNVSVLPTTEQMIICVKLASPVAGNGAATWKLGLRTSTSGQINARRNTTTADWFRLLRTTTASGAGAAAGDNMVVASEINAGVISAAMSITWNDTAGTQFGNFSSMCLMVGYGGTVTVPDTASITTTIYLKGTLRITHGGKFRMGTVANPIPVTSTCELQMIQNATDGQYTILVDTSAEFTAQGSQLRTHYRAFLAASASAGATTLTTDVATGWKTGDVVVIMPTRRTAAEYEVRVLTSDASGTTVTLPSGLSFLHDGTAPYAAEVYIVNRNVTIRGQSSTRRSSIMFATTSVVDIDHCGFRFMGSGSVGNDGYSTGVVDIYTDTRLGGVLAIRDCGFYDISNGSFFAQSVSYGWTFERNNTHVGTSGVGTWNLSNISLANFLDNWMTGYSAGLSLGAANALNIQSNRLSGMNDQGVTLAPASNYSAFVFLNNVIHSCGGPAIQYTLASGASAVTFGVNQLWRNTQGLLFQGTNSWYDAGLTFNNLNIFANQHNVDFQTNGRMRGVRWNSCTIDAGVTTVSQNGIRFGSAASFSRMLFDSCVLGFSNAHSIADLNLSTSDNNQTLDIVFHNSKLSSPTPVLGQLTGLQPDDVIGSQQHGQVEGAHKAWKKYGRLESDTVIFKTATPSERMVPVSASGKLTNQGKKLAANKDVAVTVGAQVRLSVVGDAGGANYNGNYPRLIVKANPSAGISSDTVLATATSGASGAWQQLAAAVTPTRDCVLDYRVDCDGTAGWVNVDDWTVT